jgi:DNA repair protein RadC
MSENTFSIKHWAKEDQPREKLLAKGKQSLSDAELLAILIGSGSRGESALTLCQKILNKFDNNLNKLAKATFQEIKGFKGIGDAKAIVVTAALELSKRRQFSMDEVAQVKKSEDAFKIIAPILMDLPHEEFWLLLLSRSNRVLEKKKISVGGLTSTVVDPRIIFKIAIDYQASGLVLAHNHPSGQLRPSDSDHLVTKKIVEAGKLFDITVMDHIIVAENQYYSFADHGQLDS